MNSLRTWISICTASVLALPNVAAQTDSKLSTALSAIVPTEASGAAPAPGGVIGILRRGEPIAVQAFGMAELATKSANTPDTVFYVASAAKQFTAACIEHAADAGHLSLDDSITKHVKGLPDAYRPVTLRHLLHHRSGVKDIYETAIALDLGPAVLASNTAAVEVLARLPDLDFVPGERFIYSNSGYVLLAEALQGATGGSLAKYAAEHVFRPSKMESAHYSGEPRASGYVTAQSYRPSGESFEPIGIATGLTGPGGMWASFNDLAHYDRAWVTKRFASDKVRAALLTPPQLSPSQTLHPLFGLYAGGVMVGAWRGVRTVRHAGGAFGFSAEYMRFPDQEISVIALSNHAGVDARKLAESAAELALPDKLAPDPAPSAPAPSVDIGRFGRLWRDDKSGLVWVLSLTGARSTVATLGDVKVDVVVESPTRLASTRTQVPVTFEFEPAEGPATRMRVRFASPEVASCRPLEFPPRDLPPSSDYAGQYRSAPTGASIVLRADGNQLVVVQERPILPVAPFVLPPFHAVGEDLFVCDAGAQLQFTRDAEGRVTGARMDVSRARGLMLERR